jgi:hypothetical protein
MPMKNWVRTSIDLLIVSLCTLGGASAQQAAPEPTYLPYGLRIAPGVEIAEAPRPFDVTHHGAPLRNMTPAANMVGRPGVRLPKRLETADAGTSTTPPYEPGSGDRGLWLTTGEGIYAGNDPALDLSIPEAAIGTTIYAPTHMAPGGACMETVTAHWRYEGMAATAHAHGFWDWCETDGTGGWQVFEFMDAEWRDRYVRRYRGEQRYWTQVFSDAPSSWKGLLYNFNEGRWEEKVAISGSNVSGFGSTGWTMWESHYLMDEAALCPQFPDIRASGLRVYVDGGWNPLNTGNSQDTLGPYGLCWVGGTYDFRLSKKRDTWLARTSK